MSRFRKLSHAVWHCQYYLVWCPKYRYKILIGQIKTEIESSIRLFSRKLGCEIIELNIQPDHVHLLVMVPPKVSISDLVGTLKGRAAIRVFQKFSELRLKRYWGNHFWAKGYCVDTVGVDAEMIRKYVKYQETNEKKGLV